MALRARLRSSKGLTHRYLWGGARSVALADIAAGSAIPNLSALAGRSVLVLTQHMLSAALALIELDGVARRLVLCPPDLKEEYIPLVAKMADADAVLFDEATSPIPDAGVVQSRLSTAFIPFSTPPEMELPTEWAMFTSGTTGAPKLVVHTLNGLTGAFVAATDDAGPPVWGTFYDVRRYGGLQILLRALLGGGSLVLSEPNEGVSDFLLRLGHRGVTHLTGTPSHWRTVLMSPAAQSIAPKYIRLSGEIADQGVLDSLRASFAGVPIVHAYASTEAGVGFEVADGLEGFPATLIDHEDLGVSLRVRDGVLHIKSDRTALRYLADPSPLLDDDGFVDTGDYVELRAERYRFMGRRGGVINVGGLKVHPQEVESVINSLEPVRVSRVRGQRNPITGMVVVADVVLKQDVDLQAEAGVRDDILSACHRTLERYKVPMRVRFVASLSTSASGKLERSGV